MYVWLSHVRVLFQARLTSAIDKCFLRRKQSVGNSRFYSRAKFGQCCSKLVLSNLYCATKTGFAFCIAFIVRATQTLTACNSGQMWNEIKRRRNCKYNKCKNRNKKKDDSRKYSNVYHGNTFMYIYICICVYIRMCV